MKNSKIKYKMIVTDLDDTLLNSKGKISEKDKLAIMEAQRKGVKFVLASGRPTFAMKKISEELKLHEYGSYMLSFNGGVVTNCETGEIIFQESLSIEEIHELYDQSIENKVHIITYVDDKIISETTSEYIDVEVKLTGMKHEIVDSFKNKVNKEAVKCIMLEEPEYLKKVCNILNEKYKEKYSVSISKPFFLEVTKSGIDKGKTLLRLLEKLNMNVEEVIVVGDSYNDITMLEIAGVSVAVENAKSEVKEIVHYITTSNNENGMYNLINRFINGLKDIDKDI